MWISNEAVKNHYDAVEDRDDSSSEIIDSSDDYIGDSGVNVHQKRNWEFAPWQKDWVWKDKCGVLQKHSKDKSIYYQEACFEKRDIFVDFLGASHLNYIAACLLDEIFRFACGSKVCMQSNSLIMHGHEFAQAAGAISDKEGRLNFFNGKYATDKSLFHNLTGCGDRPQDCLGLLTTMDCYFGNEHDTPKLRACATKVICIYI
jgi:hypothetical protein